ncbi:ABC transporter ATP-binding protein/permease [Roseomonas sp. NAR14]|uniref:ABC transporter ATP-binding protein/permease n=1 Tax=Roseomonas acroporae TaxID=2937791 RepID=A0A9X1Y3R3_9PROT|nr:ABC transporter ATP-binding protein/permease [Roseomonas acroporae]MCK8783006.1 ABC transporter ATP-binding protein/permease [Roseomonas acroporae]
MRRIVSFLHDAWALARPYWTSEERWRARGMLALLVVLNLSLVGLNVLLTFWQRAFYNALEARDWDGFQSLLLTWRVNEEGFLPGFCGIAAVFILIAVYQLYLRQALQIRWRRWMTVVYLERWLADRAYYRLALSEGGRGSRGQAEEGTDNPDQRIAEDVRLYVDNTLALGLDLMSTVVTLFSFVAVLWSLSGPLTLFGLDIPGYMVWVAMIYAVFGTVVTHLIGRRLIGLNFDRQRVEADFRFALMRLRENAEGIALYGGERDEHRGLAERFRALMENFWSIMVTTKRVTFFTASYSQVAIIFPFVVAAPAFFAGKVTLGGLFQISSAFGQVQGSLSWFVTSYRDLADWRATVRRLTGFDAALAAARAAAAEGPALREGPALGVEGLGLDLPDGRRLLADAALTVRPGESVVITGASGSGKSTLLRAIAGIWPFGRGTVTRPLARAGEDQAGEDPAGGAPAQPVGTATAGGTALFLPQRPYLPLGTLRRAVCYPADAARYTDAEIGAALEKAGLGALRDRLDEVSAWDRRLSGGEQQRVALARALLLRPDWLFLDEATASLDPAAEQHLYRVLKQELPGTALVSVAHRPAVAEFHDRRVQVKDGGLVEAAAAPA